MIENEVSFSQVYVTELEELTKSELVYKKKKDVLIIH